MSCCTTTVPNSVRNSEPVGQTSRQAAEVHCLHTSDDMSHAKPLSGSPSRSPSGRSMKGTWRQVSADSPPVLSYEVPSQLRPSSGTSFHSLHATSQALQPIQMDVSVKNPIRGFD